MEAHGGELGDPRRSRERWLKKLDGGTMMILICEKKIKKWVKTLELALKATKLVLRSLQVVV